MLIKVAESTVYSSNLITFIDITEDREEEDNHFFCLEIRFNAGNSAVKLFQKCSYLV